MAGKHAQSLYALDSTGLSLLSQVPPKISLNSPLLASEITLPPQPLIHCWIYTSANGSDPLLSLETARRNLVRENKSLSVTTAVLPRVHVAQDSRASALYTFSIGSQGESTPPSAPIPEGHSEGLVCSESYHFSPNDLYPCSTSCSTQLIPCSSCLSMRPQELTPENWSSACLVPRIPLRQPFAEFIHAVRDRIIEDIVQSSVSNKYGTNHRHAVRYKQGVLLGSSHATSAEWGIGWDHDARHRSLVYCELLLHLYPTRILVHPVLHSAHLLPLLTTPPSPVATGMPVTLLPHGTPAYYLNTYTGPLGNLTAQFDAAFYGLGVGDWKSSSVIPKVPHSGHATGSTHNSHIPPSPPTYIIAWLSVQNRHGEDKGMPIIWPSSLCFAPISSFSHPRPSLKFLPLVPAQLLASPPAPSAKVSSLKLSSNVLAPPFQFDEQPTPSPVATSARGSISGPSSSEPGFPAPQGTAGSVQAPRPIRPSLSRAQTADSLRAFRSLTITRKHAKTIASEVSTYVDAVARERERERERLKREREGGSLSRSGSGAIKPLEKSHETKSASSSPKKIPASASAPRLDVGRSVDVSVPAQSRHIAPPIVQAVKLPKNEPVELALPTGGIPSTSTATVASSDTAKSNATKEEVTPPANSGAHVTAESSNAFDPFSGFDSNWNQSNNDFMGMSLDNYDLNMGFSMAMNGADDGGDTFNMDDGFGVFTDDDFNFFDSPATTAKATIPTTVNGANPSGIFPLNSDNSLANDGLQTSGPGPPSAITQAQSIPWLSSALGEGMTPLSLGASTPVVAAPPELVPSTPAQTPPSHSAPVTPSVQLADQLQSCHIRRSSISSSFSSSFDPIPFAQSHKQADGKYALGKFAMATPPPDDEEALSSTSTSKPPASTWQLTYRTATDPRIGIVRRLAGAKRKRLGTEQEERQDRRGSVWLREHEEWASESVPEEPDSDVDAGQSESESEVDEDDAMDEDCYPTAARVHTPPPSYLPLGPTLVQTQFQHQYLLPLCVPLRPSGTDSEVAIGISAPLMSAPTPVSPAAILGAPSERSKALEGAAQILIKEVVENSVWRECWQASLIAAQGNCRSSGEIWMSDVRSASQLLKAVHGTGPPLTIDKTLDLDGIQVLQPPSFVVAKSDSFIRVSPPALRFWEKLGLHPRAGGKHVTAYTFFEEERSDDEMESRISEWLDKLSAVYTAKNYGTHTLGRNATCTRDGCVPVKFGELRKTLVSFVASLPELDSPLVFYIVTPTHMMNLASSPMRQVFSAIKKVKKTYPDAPILMHLLPEPLILGALHIPALNYGGLEAVADAIYNRAVLPITRNMSRALLPNGEKERALFGEPAFGLVRVLARRVKFSLEDHPITLDVMDRNQMLHVGYTISECGKWLFVAFMDEKGDSHDLRAWLVPDDEPEQFVINNVWDFAMTIAKKAHAEWHIIVTRLGAIPVSELHSWTSRLDAASEENQHLPPLQAHLLVADIEEQWNFLPDEATTHKPPITPSRTSKHSPSGAVLADISSTVYILRSKIPTMVSSSASISTEPSFIADTEEDKPLEESQIRSLHSYALIRVPAGTDHIPISMLQMNLLLSMHSAHTNYFISDQDTLDDAARNFHELAVLTQCRWKLNADPILPFHLAALKVISLALSRSDVTAD